MQSCVTNFPTLSAAKSPPFYSALSVCGWARQGTTRKTSFCSNMSRGSAEKTWTTGGDSHGKGFFVPLRALGLDWLTAWFPLGLSTEALHMTSHVLGCLTAELLGSEKGDTGSYPAEPRYVARARRKLPSLFWPSPRNSTASFLSPSISYRLVRGPPRYKGRGRERQLLMREW